MATIDQIKALMKSHFEEDNEKFEVVALQIAAHEAKIGHPKNAREIKTIINNPKYIKNSNILKIKNDTPGVELNFNEINMKDLILDNTVNMKLNRIIIEYNNRNKLLSNGLKNRSKILLVGYPGTGKTSTAGAIATELGLPLYYVYLEQIVSKYMGESSLRLKEVFDRIGLIRGVYLFDEFDGLGSDRSIENDVGEMRRILNSLLQFIEEDDSDSLIIAATNNPDLLDKALFRRFDEIIEYNMPKKDEIKKLINLKLGKYKKDIHLNSKLIDIAEGLNHADIVSACENTIKDIILYDRVDYNSILIENLENRRDFYKYKEGFI